MKYILLFSILSFCLTNNVHSQKIDFTKYVDPFIGTGGHGHTYPGASVPFGMMQLSPDTRLEGWDGCGGYHYSDSVIYGFSHTHLSGTGVPDYCDVLVVPTTGKVNFSNTEYSSKFSHKNEMSSPGYYSVLLDKFNVKAELTSTQRAGLHKYTFPKNDNSNIIIDLKHRDEVIESWIEFTGPDEIRGLRRSTGWAEDQYVYFVMKFSKPFKDHGIAVNDTLLEKVNKADGKNVKAFVSFKSNEGDVILVKVGISAVSVEGAARNLYSEIKGWDFDAVRNDAKGLWNKELGKIVAEGGTDEQMTVFYTAMYHAMLCPNLFMDTDGQFRGTDHKVHKSDGFTNYTVFSLWDTYRAEHPLFTIIDQKRTEDYINTFLAQFRYGGMLPVWELAGNETFCMIGYHSVPVIADAYIKGIRGFDADYCLNAMLTDATRDRLGLESLKKCGYVAQDQEHESVSKTLEYSYDDWCIAKFAKAIGNTPAYNIFISRAQNYKNVFDASSGFMRARQNGMWYAPFDPLEVNSNYTEANAWQYNFYVPQDIEGLINLNGGPEKFAERLDELFSTESPMSGLDLSDITGLIGQYAHGNEPSHHMAYLYDYAGMPWKTQSLVHKITSEFYKHDPDGLIGNEDCGQMSAWYVMSAMGFYSVCPGQLYYAIGTPLFPKLTINLENGNQFIIKANNVNVSNHFIQSATLNGKELNIPFVNHNKIINGGVLSFEMGPEPNLSWGTSQIGDAMTSISEGKITPDPCIQAESRVFRSKTVVELTCIDPDAKIFYTTDGTEPTEDAAVYSVPFEVHSTTQIRALAFDNTTGNSSIIDGRLYKIPDGMNIDIRSKYAARYSAGGPDALIDGIRGKTNWRLGDWQGYLGQDFEAVVDLGSVKKVRTISAGFLQEIRAWIWMPSEIEYAISEDGANFRTLSTITSDVQSTIYDSPAIIKDYISTVNINARYIRVRAKNFGKIPSWHPGAGHDSWIFIDEITIN